MKSYYYYERDEKRKPIITHCLLVDDGLVSKGIAKCSRKEMPSKKLGKEISQGRALQAMKSGCSQMDKAKVFWKKLSHDLVFSHLTSIDKKILKI